MKILVVTKCKTLMSAKRVNSVYTDRFELIKLSNHKEMSTKHFIPTNFEIPKNLETNRLKIRMLKVSDVVKDYDAVMSSVEHLQNTKPFGPCLLYTSPSPRDATLSRMPSSA